MKWLTDNLGTLVMALLLSVLTWTLLYSEKTNTIVASATFSPDVRGDAVVLRYQVAGSADLRPKDKFSVEVTGPRAQIEVITRNLVCAPILEESSFPPDKVGETEITLTRKELGLPETVAVRPLTVRVSYARFESVTLPIRAGLGDIDDRPKAGFRVEKLRVEPAQITVRLPANRVKDVHDLPIRPIRVTSRTESFPIRGVINEALVGAEIRSPQEFTVEVVITPVPFTREISNVVLHLSAPTLPEREVTLVTPRVIKVQLEGPEEFVRSIQPDQLHAYVRLDLGADAEPGKYLQQVRCDVVSDDLRGAVRAIAMPDEKPENRQATILVKKKAP